MKEKVIDLRTLIGLMSRKDQRNYQSLPELLNVQKETFSQFENNTTLHNRLMITAPAQDVADDLYFELKYNPAYSAVIKVSYDKHDSSILWIDTVMTLVDLLDSPSGLIQLSKLQQIRFTLTVQQAYSNTSFEGHICNGKLLNHQLWVEFNDVLPSLSLGQLSALIHDENDFNRLGGCINYVQSERIL